MLLGQGRGVGMAVGALQDVYKRQGKGRAGARLGQAVHRALPNCQLASLPSSATLLALFFARPDCSVWALSISEDVWYVRNSDPV